MLRRRRGRKAPRALPPIGSIPTPSSRASTSTPNGSPSSPKSMIEQGVVQPLVVRRVGSRYQLIAGERRWRAAREAGLAKVPVVVRQAERPGAPRDRARREHPEGGAEPDRRGGGLPQAHRGARLLPGTGGGAGREGSLDGREPPPPAPSAAGDPRPRRGAEALAGSRPTAPHARRARQPGRDRPGDRRKGIERPRRREAGRGGESPGPGDESPPRGCEHPRRGGPARAGARDEGPGPAAGEKGLARAARDRVSFRGRASPNLRNRSSRRADCEAARLGAN